METLFRSRRSRFLSLVFNLAIIFPVATSALIGGKLPSQPVKLQSATRQGADTTPAQALTEAGMSSTGLRDGETPINLLAGSSDAVAITTGGDYTCALLSTGGVMCWGWNLFGQLGNGTTTDPLAPVEVLGLTNGVAAIAAGGYHTCALTTAGGVKCWGDNDVGQLGDGSPMNCHMPVDVSGLSSGMTAVAAGGWHTCALTAAGGVKCWGWNIYGQLGDGTTTDRLTPVDVSGLSSGVTAIAVGGYHTCALTAAGGVKCWGSITGDGTGDYSDTPVDVSDLSSGVTAISAGGSFDSLAVGYGHTCALIYGGVKCWGWNYFGQLGDGTGMYRLTPVDVFGLSSGVTAISAGVEHTCAKIAAGGVKCWGRNDIGQLGDGTRENRLTPVDVSGLSSEVATIFAGGFHTCAQPAAGGVKCWGSNSYGQLGDGTMTDHLTPVDVVRLYPWTRIYLPFAS